MEILIAIGVAVVVLAIGLYGVPFLKDKGLIRNGLATEKQLLQMAGLVVKSMDFQGKDLYGKVIEATHNAVVYVEQVAANEDNETKKDLAVDATYDILTLAEIKVTDDIENIIELGIEIAVSNLAK